MKTNSFSFAVVVAFVVGATLACADGKRASPHERVTGAVGAAKLSVDYGRPYKKNRDIFGGLVPYGEVWRMGADEATVLTVESDVLVGELKVPKGTYSLFVLPAKDGKWQLIVNKSAKQWGAFSYDAKDDLGRVAMKVSATPALVEQFTVALTPTPDKQLSLDLSWDKTLASVAIKAAP